MAMPIAELGEVDTSKLDLVEPPLDEFWRLVEAEGLVPEFSAEGAHFYVCRFHDENAATLMAFDPRR